MKHRRIGNLRQKASHFRALEKLLRHVLCECFPNDTEQEPSEALLKHLQKMRYCFPSAKAMRTLFRAFPGLPLHPKIVDVLKQPRFLSEEQTVLVKCIKARMRTFSPHYRDTEAVSVCLSVLDAFRKAQNLPVATPDSAGNMTFEQGLAFCFYGRRPPDATVQLRMCVLLETGFRVAESELQAKVTQRQEDAKLFRSLPKHAQWKMEEYFELVQILGEPTQFSRQFCAKDIVAKIETLRRPLQLLAWKVMEHILCNEPKWTECKEVAQSKGFLVVTNSEREVRQLSAWHSQLVDEMYAYETRTNRTAFPKECGKRIAYLFSRLILHLQGYVEARGHSGPEPEIASIFYRQPHYLNSKKPCERRSCVPFKRIQNVSKRNTPDTLPKHVHLPPSGFFEAVCDRILVARMNCCEPRNTHSCKMLRTKRKPAIRQKEPHTDERRDSTHGASCKRSRGRRAIRFTG